MTSRLLFLSCSQRKRVEPGLLPAIERYDGPLFRVLRRYIQSDSSQNGNISPDIYILSAEFGLIPANHPTPNYDRRMTAERVEALRSCVLDSVRDLLHENTSYRELFLCMGREYRRVLDGWEVLVLRDLDVHWAGGSIGKQQGQLYDWLYGFPPPKPMSAGIGFACIRGVEVNITSEQALEFARRALQTDDKGATNYRMWYVRVDDKAISPKWLVSRLTGLRVNTFATDEARSNSQFDTG